MLTHLEGEELQAFEFLHQRLAIHMEEREAYERLATIECVPKDVLEVIDEEEEVILPAPAALDDTSPQVKDPVEKVNLGTEEAPMEVGLSTLLEPEQRQGLIDLLLEFKDCFAEKYEDIPGLSPKLVCHRLPTTPGEKPVQQEPQRMKTETADAVKEEAEKMFKSGIIRVAKYNEWLSNIVPVRKKNGKIRVCVDYRDLNKATLKDVYLMPMVDMLIDDVAGQEMLSFMDGTAGYHQIPVAKADIHKTTFRCSAFIGDFEYIVMP